MSYSPTLGRWISADPAGYVDGMSLYEPEESNPESRLDPKGLAAKVTPTRPERPIESDGLRSFFERYRNDSDRDYARDHQWGGTEYPTGDLSRLFKEAGGSCSCKNGVYTATILYKADYRFRSRRDALTITEEALKALPPGRRELLSQLADEFNELAWAIEEKHTANISSALVDITATGTGASCREAYFDAEKNFRQQVRDRTAAMEGEHERINRLGHRDLGKDLLGRINSLFPE
jgi:hypothetical protein